MLAQIEGAALVAQGVITELERETLALLRDRLRSGDIKHCDDDWSKDALAFDMARWRCHISMDGFIAPDWDPKCGTVGCIAGLCHAISKGLAFPELANGSTPLWIGPREALSGLFMPYRVVQRTPAEAAHAITTFLATGRAEWAP